MVSASSAALLGWQSPQRSHPEPAGTWAISAKQRDPQIEFALDSESQAFDLGRRSMSLHDIDTVVQQHVPAEATL